MKKNKNNFSIQKILFEGNAELLVKFYIGVFGIFTFSILTKSILNLFGI